MLLRAIAVAALAAGAPAAWAEVYVQNDQMYEAGDGRPLIVGEVVNGLGVPVGLVEVGASLYSESGSLVGRASAPAVANSIMPGMKAPFEVAAAAGAASAESYSLELSYEVAAHRSRAIGVTSSEMVRGGPGGVAISGTVSNAGDVTANAVRVTATLYDRHGNVAAVSSAHAVPDYLRPSSEAFFLVTVPGERAVGAVGYELVAESEEYAAVPEFPLGPAAALAAALAAGAALSGRLGRATAGPSAAAGPA